MVAGQIIILCPLGTLALFSPGSGTTLEKTSLCTGRLKSPAGDKGLLFGQFTSHPLGRIMLYLVRYRDFEWSHGQVRFVVKHRSGVCVLDKIADFSDLIRFNAGL